MRAAQRLLYHSPPGDTMCKPPHILPPTPPKTGETKRSRPADICGWTGHIQGNFALRVCEPVRASARFGAKFCPQGDTRGKEFLSRVCGQKWVSPGAWRFCDTLRQEASWASCLGVLLLNACYSVKTLREPIPAHGPYRSTCSKRFAEIRYASKSKTP